jgi:hypothetical protein
MWHVTERQLSKRAAEGKLVTLEELRLLLDITARQGKPAEAAALVDGPLARLYSSQVLVSVLFAPDDVQGLLVLLAALYSTV